LLLTLQGIGFVDFLLESGTYAALVTPALRDRLGLGAFDGTVVRGEGSNGPTLRQKVPLPEMWIGECVDSHAPALMPQLSHHTIRSSMQ